jgi:hypothetical protein
LGGLGANFVPKSIVIPTVFVHAQQPLPGLHPFQVKPARINLIDQALLQNLFIEDQICQFIEPQELKEVFLSRVGANELEGLFEYHDGISMLAPLLLLALANLLQFLIR